MGSVQPRTRTCSHSRRRTCTCPLCEREPHGMPHAWGASWCLVQHFQAHADWLPCHPLSFLCVWLFSSRLCAWCAFLHRGATQPLNWCWRRWQLLLQRSPPATAPHLWRRKKRRCVLIPAWGVRCVLLWCGTSVQDVASLVCHRTTSRTRVLHRGAGKGSTHGGIQHHAI